MRKKTFYPYLLTLLLLAGLASLIAFFNAWTFAPHTVEYKADSAQQISNIDNVNNNNNNNINNSNTNKKGNQTYVAYIVSNGWHAGVVVPAWRINVLLPDIQKRFEKSAATPAGVNYYEIGWGDRGFYEAKEITTLMAFQALFNSPGSVMHVVAVHNPAKAFGKNEVVKFCLSEAQLANLEKYIVSSFATTTKGELISRRPGLYGDSQFFEAAGTYHFLNSCNTWAAKALRSAGFDIKPTFKLFASQVMNNIDAPACQATM
jgi:uncharacterized protein (TIGR02117 family)